MGGIGDFLFGDEPEQTETSLPTLTPEQEELLKQLIGIVGGDEGLGNLEQDFGLGPSQIELASLGGLENLVNNLPTVSEGSETQQRVDEVTGAGLDAFEDIFSQGPEDIDEFFRATVQDPLLEDFSEEILPNLQTEFAGSFFGGERREAEARAREDLLDTLVQERTRFGFESREADRNRSIAAGQVFPNLGGFASTSDFIRPAASANILSQLLGTGRVGSDIRGRQLDERARRISQALGALGIPAFENVVTAQDGSSGFINNIAPSLVAGAFTLSDERLKEDIEKISETDEGLGIYKYRFKHDPKHKLRMGIMAQELEDLDPSAVIEVGGVKMVNMEAV